MHKHYEYNKIYKNWNRGFIFGYFLSRYDRSSKSSIEEGIDAKKNKAREAWEKTREAWEKTREAWEKTWEAWEKIWKETRKKAWKFKKESKKESKGWSV